MILAEPGSPPVARELEPPAPGPGQVRVRVHACGVCRTDLHIVDGELPEPTLPLVLGHQVVGEVESAGEGATRFGAGDRVGVPWLGWACGECRYCRSGRENLCPRARFTGYTLDGGYAELLVADERFCLALPAAGADAELAPLLCAGLIGYRALRMCGDAERIGLYGFGASAHIVCQVAARQGRRVFAITRPGDEERQAFARGLGAEWAGGAEELAERARRGDRLRARRRAGGDGAARARSGRLSGVRGDPHERHPFVRLRRPVDGAADPLGGQPHPRGRRATARPGRRRAAAVRVTEYALEDAASALDDLRAGRLTGSAVLSGIAA